jgi:hypothetical protein
MSKAACLPIIISCILEENDTARKLDAEAENVDEGLVEGNVGF